MIIQRNHVHQSNRLHLLGLPPEIRNKIMDYALPSTEKIRIRPNRSIQPAIIRTCRLLRDEYIQQFYYGKVFLLEIQCDKVFSALRGQRSLEKCASVFDGARLRFHGKPDLRHLRTWARAHRLCFLYGLELSVDDDNSCHFAFNLLLQLAFARPPVYLLDLTGILRPVSMRTDGISLD